MGQQVVPHEMDGRPDEEQKLAFTRALLEDIQALERMVDEGRIESGIRRIGAEQEMFLVDEGWSPAMASVEVLERLDDPRFSPELGLFNLEINASPRELVGDSLRRMEDEIGGLVAQARVAAAEVGSKVVLTGILPTLMKKHLTLDAMSPFPRYRHLNRMTVEHAGGEFKLRIAGLDELNTTHDSVMLEACNTSFQIHFQVAPDEFANLYNLAQVITAPVLAAAVNSPTFLHHRLWKETRVALFHQSLDSRSEAQKARQARPRVVFGDEWVRESVLEIYKEDIARFRLFIATEVGESALDILDRGETPPLSALCLHNGTVYRWNRPCYGVQDGVPHLRIEHRALPAGPTVLDEMANAAFFHGLMAALSEEYGDIRQVMAFDDAKANFLAAARYGLRARLQWADGSARAADELILQTLIPLARQGLKAKSIDEADIDRYMEVIEQRTRIGRTGAQWAFDSLASMEGNLAQRCQALTASIYEQQQAEVPVHDWKNARLGEAVAWQDTCRTVEQVMTRDLFTVRPDDLVDLAASLMDWEHVRHVPVEDQEGHLVGLVSHRQLLRLLGRGVAARGKPVAVREIMAADPLTVQPDTETIEAIRTMRTNRVSCLPVTDEKGKLVGIVTERDFIDVTAKLLDEHLGSR